MLDRLDVAERRYRAERAVAADESVSWVVVNEDLELHVEACAYLAGLRGAGRAFNTEKAYAGRIALYLSYCRDHGLNWSGPSLPQLMTMMRWLVNEPMPSRSRKPGATVRYRSEGTANAIMGTIGEFLSWCSLQGWVPPTVVNTLTQPKFLRYLPAGFDPGEDDQHRTVMARSIKYRVAIPGYEWLTDEEIDVLLGLARHDRDRFLIQLLSQTGMRIGEALGLRKEDMHLLPDSRVLGCRHEGPHVHVRRRVNANGAFAKARQPRAIPVDEVTIEIYAHYQFEQAEIVEDAGDMVFVNLFHAPLGKAMSYGTAYELFCRLAKQAGFRARPHMLRHSSITRLRRAGVDRRVVQEIAGHVSVTSQDPYSHVTDSDKREAVEMVAAKRRQARS
ncbi:tyrosine-type recombinase/integrase [Nonomuraea sp. NPDC049624]|uniref:tyrosine-type recombinase/integrase n=1 Tax=Nonomuraea sp. NPDC049624 TaxID=3154354 RepID=UPI003426C2B4